MTGDHPVQQMMYPYRQNFGPGIGRGPSRSTFARFSPILVDLVEGLKEMYRWV